MAKISRASIRATLSTVAISLKDGFDNNIVVEKGVTKAGFTKRRGTKRVTEVPLTTYGKVKPESVKRAQELLMEHLDEESTVDNVVVVEGKNVEKFTGDTLKIPKSKLRIGQRISNSEKVNVYVAEDLIEEYVPQIAETLNKYFGGQPYEVEMSKL